MVNLAVARKGRLVFSIAMYAFRVCSAIPHLTRSKKRAPSVANSKRRSHCRAFRAKSFVLPVVDYAWLLYFDANVPSAFFSLPVLGAALVRI